MAPKCARCGRKLKRWIVGRDRKITGKLPRYCWPGEGCYKERLRKEKNRV